MDNKEENKAFPDQLVETKSSMWLGYLLRYGITALIGGGLVLLVLGVRGYFSNDLDIAARYRILADAFTTPGVILIGVGLLVILAGEGIFNGVGYALKRLVVSLIPGPKKHETYADYLEKRKNKKKSKMLYFFVVGFLYLVVAVIFIALFYSVYQK